MATTKPTIVIVGGAFHTPDNYEKLITAFEAAGYETHCPRLPATNEARPPNADLTSDSTLLRNYVESLVRAGRTVILVGHSYGGQVCSSAVSGLGIDARAAKGLKGGVSHIVYMAGYALPEGTSSLDSFLKLGSMEAMATYLDFAEDQTGVPRDPGALFGIAGPGVEDAEVEAYNKGLARWHGKAMFQPLEGTAAWREITPVYIHTTADLLISMPEQKRMVEEMEKAGRTVQTFTLECGHCPNFSAPQGVVDAVNIIASK